MAHSSYLRKLARESLDETIVWIMRELRMAPVPVHAIVVRGTSGIVPGSIVAYMKDITLIVVRKPITVEKSHKSYDVEVLGSVPPFYNYIFLDDQKSTGTTHTAVVDAMRTQIGATYVGRILYSTGTTVWGPPETKPKVTFS